MRPLAFAIVLALGTSTALAPAAAQDSSVAPPQIDPEFAELQQRDAQLFAAGWRLARANAPFCKEPVPSIGVMLHDASTYGRPDQIRTMLGLIADIAVQAVAPGSPAENAGFAPNDTLLTFGALDLQQIERTEPSWQRLFAIENAMTTDLVEGPAAVTWTRMGNAMPARAVIEGILVCPTRFEVHHKGDRAVAEGTRVIFGRKFPGFDYAEDEFAAAVAHELAHNLLGHRELLDEQGRKRRLVRLTERDADRLMPWLLRNAGYDAEAAIRFMKRWGPEHGGGLLRKRTHDGWDERVEFIRAEIDRMNAVAPSPGGADWSAHFIEEARGGELPGS